MRQERYPLGPAQALHVRAAASSSLRRAERSLLDRVCRSCTWIASHLLGQFV